MISMNLLDSAGQNISNKVVVKNGNLNRGNNGRFNNYVTLKLPFLTHLSPPSRFVTFVHETPLALRHAQHKYPPPFTIKNEILGFKKDRSRSKEILNINSNI